MIGIVGGMGPAAGVRLAQLIVEMSPAACDQEHPSFVLLSEPALIADRSEFLLGRGLYNPGEAIAGVVRRLVSVGATVVAIPCSTAHAPQILEPSEGALRDAGVSFVHLVREAATSAGRLSSIGCVGVLSTEGTRRVRLYEAELEREGVRVVHPDRSEQDAVTEIIGRVKRGLVPDSGCLDDLVGHLSARGADVVLLGCTELPLAVLGQSRIGPTPIIDPLAVVAAAVLAAEFASAP